MSTLLEIRENLRDFYTKFEIYLTPLFKFLLALLTFVLLNSSLGYMTRLNNIIIMLILALMCSFLPVNFILLIDALMAVLHFYAVSLETAIVGGAVFLLLFLLYFRFSPKEAIAVALLPVFFGLKIPYLIPLALGLVGSITSVVSAACGVVVYYLLIYVKENAAAISAMEGSENALARFRFLIDGMINNKTMYVLIMAFAATVVVVYLLRRLPVDYCWTIAIVIGSVVCIVAILMGDLSFETNISIMATVIGTLVSALLCKVLEFFVFNVDYSRTEYVQFEDDEYYYYVRAVPKNSVGKSKKTVKKITSVL
ncbi:MAG: hypothetical protein E7294_03275 [Lachnospiraceae bacterium]|jgi:hypothetical protein|nr:hypothetical protein [Lachnospiraceae bacterium]